jgi:signal transduction histidine kinase
MGLIFTGVFIKNYSEKNMRAEDLLRTLPVHYYVIDLTQKKIIQTNDPKVKLGKEPCFMQLFNKRKPCMDKNGNCLSQQNLEDDETCKFIMEGFEGGDKKYYKAELRKLGEDLVIATYSDITQEMVTAKEMKINNRRLERAEKLASFGSWEIDLQNLTMFGTQGACDIYGIKNRCMPLAEVKKIALPEYRGILDKELEDLVDKKMPYNVRYKIKRPDNGQIRHIHSIAEYREDKNMIFGVSNDITEVVNSQGALHESLTDLSLAQQIAQIGNWKFDPENKTLQWSAQVLQILGEKEIPDHPAIKDFEKFTGEKHFALFKKSIHEAINNGKPFDKQFKIILEDKSEKWIEIICRPDKFKGPVGYFLRGTIQDISTSKKLEEELKKAKQKAEESDRLKSLFLANMSHEIRTPLNGILGFSSIICANQAVPEQLEYFGKIIQNCGQRLTAVIDDIIDISLIQSNQLKIELHLFDINEMLEEMFVFYKTQKAGMLENVKIKLNLCKNTEHKMIFSDKNRIYQVLKNLLDNAFKFTEKGYIEFGCCTSADNELVLMVKDTGIGIDKDKTDIIFQTFRQAREGLSRRYEGTGLGLAIVAGIVERLGGKVWVDSKPDHGSAFYVSIPRAGNRNPGNDLQPESKQEHSGKNNVIKRIVSFEDDPASTEYLKSTAGLLGCEFVNFHSPVSGLAYLRRNHADLVLMDVRLPEMNGFEITRIIKSEFPGLPVIIQTAYAMKGDREKAFSAGCDEYLSKPVSLKELKQKINEYVGVLT